MAGSVDSRLGAWGVPREAQGSFAGKVPQVNQNPKVISTQVMMLPIDVVIAGQQPIKGGKKLAQPLGDFTGIPRSVFGED